MFEELSQYITTDEGKAALKVAQDKFTTVTNELQSNEKKLIDAISSRDKYKEFTKLSKTALGIKDGEELNADTVKDKISGLTTKVSSKASEVEDNLHKEIANLEELAKESELKYSEGLASRDQKIFDIQFDARSNKAMIGLNFGHPDFAQIIDSKIKEGVKYNDELKDFVYINEDKTIKRNADTTPLTLEQRITEVTSDDSYSHLFKAPSNSGSGTGQSSGEGEGKGGDEFDQYMADL